MKMKKILLTISIIVALGLNVNAQIQYSQTGTDGFFTNNTLPSEYREMTDDGILPTLPGRDIYDNQWAVPTGSGLLLLVSMGAAYALRRKRK